MKINFLTKITTYKKFLFSYILLILVSVSFFLSAYIAVENSITTNLYKYNIALLEQSKYIMDGNVKEINILVEKLSLNSAIKNLVSEHTELDNPIALQISQALWDAKQTGIVSEAVLYIKNKDKIISSLGIYNSNEFFQKYSKFENYSIDQFKEEYLDELHYKKILPLKKVEGSGKNFIVYSQSIPVGTFKKSDFKILIYIDVEKILDIIRNVGVVNNGSVYITDKNGEVILNGSKQNYNIKNLVKQFQKKSAVVQLKDGSYTIIYTVSQENSWVYMVFVPQKLLFKEITQLKVSFIFICLLYIATGILITCILVNKNYRPIESIVHKLSKYNNASETKINDMDFISSEIDNLKMESWHMNKIIREQTDFIRQDFWKKLLMGQYKNMELEELNQKNNVHFVSEIFNVVIIDVKYEKNGNKFSEIKEWHIVYFAVDNVIKELLERENPVRTMDVAPGRIGIIINIPKQYKEEQYWRMLKDSLNTLIKLLEQELDIEASVGISSIGNTISDIDKLYGEANEALKYNNYQNDVCIFEYADIKNHKHFKTIAEIKTYIDENYMYNNLGIANIAEKFDITAQYLSVFFKKITGGNLQDYIAKVRVEYAKDLLKNSEITILQIAHMVGYSNDVGFIRVFKKYEGVTPGKYRSQN